MRGYKKWLIAVAALAVMMIVLVVLRSIWAPHYYITQYADDTGIQAMFYTIESDRGDLIVIDGGNAGNADYVRSVIEEKGGHVDAWFLTHPHPDHIGAFNILWDEMQDKIDMIYASDIDYAAYYSKAQEWDDIASYDTFLNYMSESDKLVYLHTGDKLKVCGLRFKILHSYEGFVDETSNDICNNGSLMMRVTNQKESMLFCADIGVGMSEKIISQFPEDIKCDYIQMGHHGNGGLSEAFYRLAAPRAAFFDAPEWLMNPEEGNSYTTPANRQLMESLGAEIYYYATAPNRIELN